MNETILRPESIDDLHAIVADHDVVLPVGNRTKCPLSDNVDATIVSVANLFGVIEYEPSEYTFTAWAGTTIQTLVDVLAARNQYLPFDPPLGRCECLLQ